MAISIVRGSENIRVTTEPSVSPPTPDAVQAIMRFRSNRPEFEGTVQFSGAAGDSRAGWTVGWIQTEWVETNWHHYRGQFNNHGSIFLQRARPPARPLGATRDTLVAGDIFTRPTDVRTLGADPFPVTITFTFGDSPGDLTNLVEQNTRTGQSNYLRETQLEFMFCTVFSVRDPANNFHHLASVYWNLRQQYRFHVRTYPPASPADWRVTPIAAGTGAGISRVIHGEPTDTRFRDVLTTAATDNSNTLALAAFRAVSTQAPHAPPIHANRHEALVWENFDVRKP